MIVNLTQHLASEDQKKEGVIDLSSYQRACLIDLLTFKEMPSEKDIQARAKSIAFLAAEMEADQAMVGCAMWLVEPLCNILRILNIEPVYAFSLRESKEEIKEDGSVLKTSEFRHVGFIPG